MTSGSCEAYEALSSRDLRQSPLYYQELRGFDVLGAALVLIPQGVGSFLTRTVTVPLALAGPGTSEWWLGAVLLVRGLGLGVAIGAVVLESAVASCQTLTQAFGQAFWWTTGFTVLAVLASFFLPGRPGRLITGN